MPLLVAMQSPIQKVLPMHVDSALGASQSARSDALDLLDGLLCPGMSARYVRGAELTTMTVDGGQTYESLMDNAGE